MVVSFLIVLVLLIFYGSDYHYILGCRSLEYQAYGGEYSMSICKDRYFELSYHIMLMFLQDVIIIAENPWH